MKMNKIIAGILACSVIGGTMCYNYTIPENANLTASAESYTNGTYESLRYYKYSDHIEISFCDEAATEVVIPAEIDGLPVTRIGLWAFKYCSNLKSIIIPDSVTSIGGKAFCECTGLTSLTIPGSVTSIEYDAFYHCSGLTSIIIPDSVKSIERFAFGYCTGLTSITISNSVTSIENAAFYLCDLTSITIENPDCEINDDARTISSGYDENYNHYFNGTIFGYENSTAQAYAKKNGYKFVNLGKASVRLGDVDSDDSIDSNDASMVLAEYANVSTGHKAKFTEKQKKAADLNADGQIDSSLILSYYSYTSTGGDKTLSEFLNII